MFSLLKAMAVFLALVGIFTTCVFVLSEPCDRMDHHPACSGRINGEWDVSCRYGGSSSVHCNGFRELVFVLDPAAADGAFVSGTVEAGDERYSFTIAETRYDNNGSWTGERIHLDSAPPFLTDQSHADGLYMRADYRDFPFTDETVYLSFGKDKDGYHHMHTLTRR